MHKDFKILLELSKKIQLLTSISRLLEWDQETYMPPEGATVRAEQVELMAELIHQRKTHPNFGEALARLEKAEHELSDNERAALREWKRDYKLALALPPPFVKKFAKVTSESISIWATARKNNDFAHFAPTLKNIISLCKERASFIGFDANPYDALLDTFEPGLTISKVSPLFKELKEGLLPLLKKIQSAPQIKDDFLYGDFSHDEQLDFGNELLKAMGHDSAKGRLDLSTHPFSMAIHPSDSRITTRITAGSFFDCIGAVLHEAGHSLYEMGLLPEYYGSPICEPASYGIHESQSRFWETRIGQSKPFWSHFLPKLQKRFPQLEGVALNDFYRAINRVIPSCTRVEADEVTYSLHVILRYEMERDLISGSLPVDQIPARWNETMQELLGITPPSDAEGCLQDIHWSFGAFGYFPSYTLGNLYASQFFEAFEEAYPDWESRVQKGELTFIREWLNQMIHQHGRVFSAEELVEKVTGKPASAAPYLSYLHRKYNAIYS